MHDYLNKTLTIMLVFLATTTCFGQPVKWQHYKHLWNYSIDLPDIFSTGSRTASSIQYYKNSIDSDNITLIVYANGTTSKALMLKDYRDETANKSVTMKTLKINWFVVSGVEENGGIYYIKEFIGHGNTYTLRLTYSSDYKSFFDSILGRIAKSFQ